LIAPRLVNLLIWMFVLMEDFKTVWWGFLYFFEW
jgi:hypothetical protein